MGAGLAAGLIAAPVAAAGVKGAQLGVESLTDDKNSKSPAPATTRVKGTTAPADEAKK